jgi:hypothetical protein
MPVTRRYLWCAASKKVRSDIRSPAPLDVVRHVLMDTLTLVADPRRVSDVAAVRALEVAYGIPPTGSVGAAGA